VSHSRNEGKKFAHLSIIQEHKKLLLLIVAKILIGLLLMIGKWVFDFIPFLVVEIGIEGFLALDV
jgi:hypothetical protein